MGYELSVGDGTFLHLAAVAVTEAEGIFVLSVEVGLGIDGECRVADYQLLAKRGKTAVDEVHVVIGLGFRVAETGEIRPGNGRGAECDILQGHGSTGSVDVGHTFGIHHLGHACAVDGDRSEGVECRREDECAFTEHQLSVGAGNCGERVTDGLEELAAHHDLAGGDVDDLVVETGLVESGFDFDSVVDL